MFLIAANFISGKQERTSFTQGVGEMASRLQDISEQVTDGHYSDIPLTCINSGGNLTINTTATPGQGTNQGCVFLGKIIHFYGPGSGQPAESYEVFSMADARSATGSLPNNSVAFIPGLTTQSTMPQNLEVKKVRVTLAGGGTDSTAYNIGFAQGLGTADTLAVTDPTAPPYQSGSQTAGLVYESSGLNKDSAQSGNETTMSGNGVVPAASARVCLSDDTRYAWIYLGGQPNNANQLSINVKQLGKRPC